MANSKISALTSASTPLAGTEVLPIVQSSATKKVAVSDLTAGRSVSGSTFEASSGAPGFSTTNQTTNAARAQFVNTGGTAYIGLDSSVGGLGGAYTLNVWHSGNYDIVFGVNNTAKMKLFKDGKLSVNDTTTPAYNTLMSTGGFYSYGTQQFNITANNGSAAFEWVLRSGTGMDFYVQNATVLAQLSAAGVWTNASDARHKENIRPIAYGLQQVLQLQPRAYNMIDSKVEQIGFVAQEVESVLPELVDTTVNSVTGEERMTLSYGQMTAVLVKAIQELKAEVDQLKSQLTGNN